MSSYPAPLARLIQELSKLPGIGEKSAARLAFHLLKGDKEDVFRLSESIGRLRQEIGFCQRCFGFCEVKAADEDAALCTICRNFEREKDKICVVEEPADLIAVEKSQEFRGQYHVLHGTISPLDGIGPDALRIKELLDRLRDSVVKEVIVATN
ncbi:MAG: recombination mediator RecR, partial [Candidatus Binatia bacterium]